MTKTILFFIFIIALCAPCFAQSNYSETLTITTYYPAPYGVYRNLRLHPSEEPQTGVAPGVMYFNQTQGKVLIYINNTVKWQPLGGPDPAKTALVNSAHSEKECTDLKGEVVASDGFLNLCRFNSTDCPDSWSQYKLFSTCEAGVASCDCKRKAKPWGPEGYGGTCQLGGSYTLNHDCPQNKCNEEPLQQSDDCVPGCIFHPSKRIQIGCY